MSIMLINLIKGNRSPSLTMVPKFLLMTLASHASNKDFGAIYPSINLLADEMGCSPRTVIRATHTLIKIGYLTKLSLGNNRTHTANSYEINVKKLEQERIALRPTPVDNSVSKCVDKIPPSDSQAVPASDRESWGVVTESHPIKHKHQALSNKHLMLGQQQDVFLNNASEMLLHQRMVSLKVFPSIARKYLRLLGKDIVALELQNVLSSANIRNPGGALMSAFKRLAGNAR